MTFKKQSNTILADHDTWLEVDISTPKHPDTVMLVDKADWDEFLLSEGGRVHAFPNGANTYARFNKRGRSYQFHRWLMGNPVEVDHINHSGLDNRRINLRVCTRNQNNMNRSVQPNNTSGVTGVVWDKCNSKWKAQIALNGKLKNLGRYTLKGDAVKARKDAEKKYFGEYAYQASQSKG